MQSEIRDAFHQGCLRVTRESDFNYQLYARSFYTQMKKDARAFVYEIGGFKLFNKYYSLNKSSLMIFE